MKNLRQQIEHQIQVEYDSNKGLFSETFVDSILEAVENYFLITNNRQHPDEMHCGCLPFCHGLINEGEEE